MRVRRLLRVLGISVLLAGCGSPPAGETAAVEPAAPPERDGRPLIVAFGDSLTAGHGPADGRSYPAFLQQEVDRLGFPHRVVNAGVGGDTTASGLARVDSVIAMQPEIVILAFGGNDGLRGLPVPAMQENLEEMIVRLKGAGIQVVLAGMTLPPNYGRDYIRRFEQVYEELAARHGVPFIPFLLEGVGGNPEYMQADGIHPSVKGNRRVADHVLRTLEPLLKTRRP